MQQVTENDLKVLEQDVLLLPERSREIIADAFGMAYEGMKRYDITLGTLKRIISFLDHSPYYCDSGSLRTIITSCLDQIEELDK